MLYVDYPLSSIFWRHDLIDSDPSQGPEMTYHLAETENKFREQDKKPIYMTPETIRGWWTGNGAEPDTADGALADWLKRVRSPIYLLQIHGRLGVSRSGKICIGRGKMDQEEGYPLLAYAPALPPEDLGDPVFKETYGLRYSYVAGAMANGITSVDMVSAMGKAGMIGFFGAAGLHPDEVEDAMDRLQRSLGDIPFGSNLIYSPNDPELEAETVRRYLNRKVRNISASAYLDLSLPLVLYRVKGIHQESGGNIVCPNRVVAKVSRVEVARRFLSPPPEKMLNRLLEQNLISRTEAELARHIPMAHDMTAEADSGGHTDNRPALALLPTMIALRNEMQEKYKYQRPPCVGLAGGISTPASAAAAFAMGAAYVLTGSVNQSCIEAGTSAKVRDMLCEACQADITMAPAADMFEMGVKVQVLKRGTMFPQRAAKLYEIYRAYPAYEAVPENQRKMLERDYFKTSFEEEWESTRKFFEVRDPAQIERAAKDPRHKMALVFRSYLGRASGWAVSGVLDRVIDYQIWCGPSLGAFNEWVRGSFLEKPENRKSVTVAMNLMVGASLVTRASWLRNQGVRLPAGAGDFSPVDIPEINRLLENQNDIE